MATDLSVDSYQCKSSGKKCSLVKGNLGVVQCRQGLNSCCLIWYLLDAKQNFFPAQAGEGKAVDLIYLDFNTVSHSILLEKLAAHGLDGCTLCWIKNWLDGQT